MSTEDKLTPFQLAQLAAPFAAAGMPPRKAIKQAEWLFRTAEAHFIIQKPAAVEALETAFSSHVSFNELAREMGLDPEGRTLWKYIKKLYPESYARLRSDVTEAGLHGKTVPPDVREAVLAEQKRLLFERNAKVAQSRKPAK